MRRYRLIILCLLIAGIGAQTQAVPCSRGCGGVCYLEHTANYGVLGLTSLGFLANRYLGPNAGMWIATAGGLPSAALLAWMQHRINRETCLHTLEKHRRARMAALIGLLTSLAAGGALEYYNYYYEYAAYSVSTEDSGETCGLAVCCGDEQS